jgi:cytochrome c
VLAAASHAADLGRDLPHTLLGKPLAAPSAALTVWPDGRGLPAGQGSAVTGERLYVERCQGCHGERGTGGSGGHLAGRSRLNGPHPDRTVGNYWPYATTVFDYMRRAMPPQAPWSLSVDETYALTAYVLYLGGVLPADAQLDQATLAKVMMPNRFGFILIREP